MHPSRPRVLSFLFLSLAVLGLVALPGLSQERSVRPGINKPFENPDVKEFVGKFEVESREVFAKRHEIVAACKLKPGMVVGDIGAGTGLFTRLFAKAVGDQGKVYAVDISPKFIEYIEKTCREKGINNVTGVVCKPDSVELPPRSIDLAFICDTYHHFEFPFKTMASIHRALRPGGRVVLVDFKRIPGMSSEWVLNHVRAGQETVTKEILSTGFKIVEEPKFLTENYCVVFEKAEPALGDVIKQEMLQLEGEWSMISGVADGQSMPKEAVRSGKRIAKDGKTTILIGGRIYFKADFSIDPSKKPKAIDYTMTDGPTKGKTHLGIYELDGDTIKFCFAAPGKDRPTDFTAKEGSLRTLSIWKRAEKSHR